MKNNENWNATKFILIFLTVVSILFGVRFNNDLNDYKKSDSFYQEYSDYYVKQSEKCESELNDIKEDAAFLMNQFDKMAVMCDKEVLLLKDKCPICPIDEVCIKAVILNKNPSYQCINRELIGG